MSDFMSYYQLKDVQLQMSVMSYRGIKKAMHLTAVVAHDNFFARNLAISVSRDRKKKWKIGVKLKWK